MADRGPAALALDLAGRSVLVSAGGTREDLDPVRYLGNWSSGRQGYALAATAASRGARVTLVAANTELPDPAGVRVIRVGSARDLRDAMLAEAAAADAIVMAAAVADFRPARPQRGQDQEDRGGARADRAGREPRHAPGAGRRPAAAAARSSWASPPRPATCWPTAGPSWRAKGCDLLVVNQVGQRPGLRHRRQRGRGARRRRPEVKMPRGPKEALADVIWDLVAGSAGCRAADLASCRTLGAGTPPINFGATFSAQRKGWSSGTSSVYLRVGH